MQDIVVGRLARALRQRLRLRQADVGVRAGLSQGAVSLVERGHLDRLPIRRVRRLFAVFDAEVVLVVRWRGGEIDRLLDKAHAALGSVVTSHLTALGWELQPEVSYSVYGERGSIDLLGWHARSRALLVIELKTEITSVEETLRRHDAKVRLAPAIAVSRFGWEARSTSRLLALPADRTSRRQIARHEALFARTYALRTVAVRRWLVAPVGSMTGIAFVSDTAGQRAGQPAKAPRRIQTIKPRS